MEDTNILNKINNLVRFYYSARHLNSTKSHIKKNKIKIVLENYTSRKEFNETNTVIHQNVLMNVERFKVICFSYLVLYSSSSVATLIDADKHLEGRKTEKEKIPT